MGVAQQPRNAKGITGSIQLAAAVAAQVIGCHMVPGVRQYLGIMELGQQAGGKISGGIAGGLSLFSVLCGGDLWVCAQEQPRLGSGISAGRAAAGLALLAPDAGRVDGSSGGCGGQSDSAADSAVYPGGIVPSAAAASARLEGVRQILEEVSAGFQKSSGKSCGKGEIWLETQADDVV